jgi:nucleoside-diphosphate-sugar epimerase
MNKNKKKIIVTGSAGFIGYSLSNKLLEQGNNVMVLIIIMIIMIQKLKNARLKKLK